MPARLRTAAVVLAGVLALGACTSPGDDAPGPEPTTSTAASPEQEITEALTALATSSDPSQCTDLYTANGLEVAVGSSDVQVCRDAVVGSEPADDAVVDEVVVDGDTATGRVTAVGGASAGLAQVLALVREDGRWKVDDVAGLEIADRAALDAHTAEGLRRWGPDVLPPDYLPCIEQQLRAVTDAEIVAAFQEGRTHEASVSAISACMGGGVDAAALFQIVTYQLQTRGLTQEQADCVAVEALGTYLELTLEELVSSEAARRHLDEGLLEASGTDVCQRLATP